MNIWIVGSKGMLGSHFIRLLDQKKIQHSGTDLDLDITQLDQVDRFVGSSKITHIINCAAYTQVDKAETDRERAYSVNVIGSQNLGIASHKWNIPIISYSTDYVFDGQAKMAYTEDDRCSPINYYGLSKWLGERALLNETKQACIIRTSWLFGFPGKNFVETMLRLMQEKVSLRIIDDQIGRPTYAQDLAEISLQMLGAQGIYHFANAQPTTWYGFAQEICRQARERDFPLKIETIHPIKTEEYPTPAKRPALSTLSTDKIEKLVGIQPRPWQQALDNYLEIYQKSLLTKV
jgi:dTDP-4-dehydrorhamnose reductase